MSRGVEALQRPLPMFLVVVRPGRAAAAAASPGAWSAVPPLPLAVPGLPILCRPHMRDADLFPRLTGPPGWVRSQDTAGAATRPVEKNSAVRSAVAGLWGGRAHDAAGVRVVSRWARRTVGSVRHSDTSPSL